MKSNRHVTNKINNRNKSMSLYLHLFIDVDWISKSPVVEGEVKVDTSASVVRLSHPWRKTAAVKFRSNATKIVESFILGNSCCAWDSNDEQRMDRQDFMDCLLEVKGVQDIMLETKCLSLSLQERGAETLFIWHAPSPGTLPLPGVKWTNQSCDRLWSGNEWLRHDRAEA